MSMKNIPIYARLLDLSHSPFDTARKYGARAKICVENPRGKGNIIQI